METKTFKNLSIGDVFYRCFTNYESAINPRIEKVTVQDISAVNARGEGERLRINRHDGHSSVSYCIDISFEDSDVSRLPYRDDGFYTTDYDEIKHVFRDIGMKNIKRAENEIATIEEKIKKIKVGFWEFLHPTTYPNPEIKIQE